MLTDCARFTGVGPVDPAVAAHNDPVFLAVMVPLKAHALTGSRCKRFTKA